TQLSGTADDLDDVTGDVGTNVTSIRSTLGAIAKKLDSSAATVKELITKLGDHAVGLGDQRADCGGERVDFRLDVRGVIVEIGR
ncbi:hypothetical protein, partial [Acinetobacter baumannii]|uniref:hypothetical protein n=1 Tax=Acinetobacter baumannii TaxID=470 RepID=UPI0031F44ED2